MAGPTPGQVYHRGVGTDQRSPHRVPCLDGARVLATGVAQVVAADLVLGGGGVDGRVEATLRHGFPVVRVLHVST